MAKQQMYRINPLPGIKKCIDYMRKAKSGNTQSNSKPKVKKGY
jgi:hypothetical protein